MHRDIFKTLRKHAVAAFVFGFGTTACNDELTEPLVEPVPVMANSDATEAGDRSVLVALYEATNGPDWDDSDNWLTDAPLNAWHGVETTASGRVRRLDLGQNNLEGKIPPELGNLTNLEELDLGWNKLEGKIPPELGNLTNLGVLDLFNAGSSYWGSGGLGGKIPPELGNLTNLTVLSLGRNDLTDDIPPELSSLANLTYLLLPGNRLSGVLPPELADFSLTTLYWDDNAGLCAPGTRPFISFVADIKQNDSGPFCHDADADVLRNIHQSTGGSAWTQTEGWLLPGPLGEWYGVETDTMFGRVVGLDLRNNGLTGRLPTKLASLDSLRHLRLDGNAQLGGRLPLAMTAMALGMLSYEGTTLCTPESSLFRAWLGSLSSHAGTGIKCPPLTDRNILEVFFDATGGQDWKDRANWLTDAPLNTWHGVQTTASGQVRELALSENDLEGSIPPELGSLSNLASLILQNNDLEGSIPPELGNLLNLEHLDLRGNNMEGSIPAELGNLPNLQVLVLSGNDLEGSIPPELGSLSNLATLYLSRNNLEGSIPPEVGNLSNLAWLTLWSNDLEGSIPPELGNLSKLRLLDLDGNNMEGSIPPELGNLSNLRVLDLRSNDLEGSIPPELGNLSNLATLYLQSNDLEGSIPPEVGNLSNLATLYLNSNDLEGSIPPEVGNLSNLATLFLSENPGLFGALPRSFSSLNSLERLSLGGTALCISDDFAMRLWLRSMWSKPYAPICKAQATGATATAYIVQGVQSSNIPVPLVAGKPGLLRVLVAAPDADGAPVPAAWATFYQRDGSKHNVRLRSGSGTIPAEVEVAEGSLLRSANVEIPGDVLRPGVEMVVVVDPEGVVDPALGVPRRIPAMGHTALDVYEMPLFDVTVVPFLWEPEPDSSILGLVADESLFEETRLLLPIGEMSVTIHEPVWTSTNNGFELLDETALIRRMEGGTGYYMGTAGSFTGGIGGVAYLNARTMFSGAWAGTVAHEFGHNLSLRHAPCGTEGDPAYPHSNGRIGVWGYDHRSRSLVSPRGKDIMSYCGNDGISDYSFAKAFWWRLSVEAGVVEEYEPEPTGALMLWGGVGADGRPFLNPAFVVEAPPTRLDATGAWQIAGEAEDGRVLFNRRFEMSETADGDGRSSFALALAAEAGWAGTLSRIVLTGPDGTVAMDAESGSATALLRDPASGRVRGILRDWPGLAAAAGSGVAGGLTEQALEVQVSRGIPRPDAWR